MSRLPLSLVYAAAALLLAGLWSLAALLTWSWWIWLGVGLAVSGTTAWAVWRLRRGSVHPDALQTLRRRWRAAVEELQAAAPGHLHPERPWYLVLGPPGAGKTSLLRSSGLGLAPAGPPGSAVEPTVGFTLLRSGDQVFLDCAGRLATDPAAEAEWRLLVDLAGASRRQAGFQAVLVCFDLPGLLKRGEAAAQAEAALLRVRLAQAALATGRVAPLHLVFTRCDGLGGFKDFFAGLPRSERDQPLGAFLSWPLIGDPVAAWAEEHRLLASALHDRRLEACRRALGDDEALRKLVQFPIQFQALHRMVGTVVGELERGSGLQDAPLRGVWFTSAQRPPRPRPSEPAPAPRQSIEQSVFVASSQIGVPPPATPVGKSEEDGDAGLFIRHLLSRQLAADRGQDRPTRRAQRWVRGLRIASLGLAPALAVVLIFLIALGAYRQVGLVESARMPAQQALEAERQAPGDVPRALAVVDRLGLALADLADTRAHRLRPATEAAAAVWRRQAGRLILEPCLKACERDLERLRSAANTPGGQDELYELFRAYQMLTGLVPCAPAALDGPLVQVRRWYVALDPPGGRCDWNLEVLARRQLDHVANRLAHEPGLLRLNGDQRLVEAVSRDLGETLWIRRGYEDAVRSLSGSFPALRVEGLVPGAVGILDSSHGFSSLFSQRGWDESARAALREKAAALETTLRGLRIATSAKDCERRLVERFAEDQQRHWLQLIGSMRAAEVPDVRDVPERLALLAGNHSPIPTFLRAALGECSLRTSGIRLFSGSEALPWIPACLAALGELRRDVQDFCAATEPGRRNADPALLFKLGDRYNAVSARIAEVLAPVAPPERREAVRKGFDSLLASLWEPLARELAQEHARLWRDRAAKPFRERYAARFPFAAEATEEVSLDDFAGFLGPSGELWQSMSPIEALRARQVAGAPMLVMSTDYERCAANVAAIHAVLFAEKSQTVNAPLLLTFVQREGVEDIAFSLGEQVARLYDRPDGRAQVALRQAEPPACRIAIKVLGGEWRSLEFARQPWGLMRLLRAGDPRLEARGGYLCTWPFEVNAGGSALVFRAALVVEATGIERALVGELLTRFKVPEEIAP